MPKSLRLVFEYRDGNYVSLAPKRVEMAVPQTDHQAHLRSAGGRFVELRSAEGETILSARVPSDHLPTVEYPTGDAEQPFGRTAPPPGSIVTVVVPADDRATMAALVDVSTSRTPGEFRMTKRDLATVSLTDGDEQ